MTDCRHCGTEREPEGAACCPALEFELAAKEYALRLADVADVVDAIDDAEGEGYLGPLLSVIDHALRGDSGCVEPAEWEAKRERSLRERGEYLGLT